MKIFWYLYRKEFRALTWPGIGLILLWNIGGLLNAINYVSSSFYLKNLQYLFRPVSITPGSTVVFLYTMLFLYAVLHQHLIPSRYQDFILPCKRWQQLAALFAAVVTWVTSVPLFALVLDKLYGLIHILLPSLPRLAGVIIHIAPPGINTNTIYTFHSIAEGMSYIVIIGIGFSLPIVVGYIVTVVMHRLPNISMFTAAFTGLATIMLELLVAGVYVEQVSKLLLVLPLSVRFMSLVLSIVMLFAIILTLALFLYERYAEV